MTCLKLQGANVQLSIKMADRWELVGWRDSRNRGLTPGGSFHLSHYIYSPASLLKIFLIIFDNPTHSLSPHFNSDFLEYILVRSFLWIYIYQTFYKYQVLISKSANTALSHVNASLWAVSINQHFKCSFFLTYDLTVYHHKASSSSKSAKLAKKTTWKCKEGEPEILRHWSTFRSEPNRLKMHKRVKGYIIEIMSS